MALPRAAVWALPYCAIFAFVHNLLDYCQFGQKRAIHPDDLITWTLPKLAGYSRALKWLYAGTDIPLTDAQHAGLIEPVVNDDDLMPTAMAFANTLAAGPTVQYALTKQAGISEPRTLGQCCIGKLGANTARQTSDFKEGINAFREKRKAQFTGE